MALWGSRDSFSITGTVDVVNVGDTTTVTGTSTDFLVELEIGDTIIIEGTKRKITAIASANSLTIDPAWDAANVSGGTATGQDAPKYVLNTDISGNSIFGVDSTEAGVANNISRGMQNPGWVRYETYTDANSNVRYKNEVLVAMSSITNDADQDDTVLEDS